LPACTAPADVQIERQVLAEPEPTLNERTWAALGDGTPLVTAARRGKGLVVLFHVTADTSWSNLPLSGVFVDMLRRIMPLAVAGPARNADASGDWPIRAACSMVSAPCSRRRRHRPRHCAQLERPATAEHPPGFYGPPEASIAVNTLAPDAVLSPLDLAGQSVLPLEVRPPLDLRPAAAGGLLVLFLLDALAVLWLAGCCVAARGTGRRCAHARRIVLAAVADGSARAPRHRQPVPSQPSRISRRAFRPRLAYITHRQSQGGRDQPPRPWPACRTGDGHPHLVRPRHTCRAGPGQGRDGVLFADLLADHARSADAERCGTEAHRPVHEERRHGDFRYARCHCHRHIRRRHSGEPPSAADAGESRYSRDRAGAARSCADQDLLPARQGHRALRAGETWIEAMPRGSQDDKRPARAGDRVSPVIITSNDLAAAWAVDKSGSPRFPMVPGEPRQREMALRSGVNLVMYAMTGNYKADQVHIPALLERLGQ
jgi:hypothetical protein